MGQRLTPRHERQGSCRSPVPLSYVASTLGIHITRDDNAQAPITSEMKARCPSQRGYVGLRPDRCDIQHCARCCCCRFRCHKAPSAWPSRQSGVAGTAVRPEGVAGTAVRHGRNGSQAELRRCTSISNVALTAVRPDRRGRNGSQAKRLRQRRHETDSHTRYAPVWIGTARQQVSNVAPTAVRPGRRGRSSSQAKTAGEHRSPPLGQLPRTT